VKLLLDTHIWLWALSTPDRLSPAVRDALASGSNEVWLSPISVWEAHLLAERGRIQVTGSPRAWVEQMVLKLPRREAVLTHDIAVASRTFDWSHQDPADRFLAATAMVLGLTLVTADSRLIGATEFAVLANTT
jgi:PIN domain nuclease of toxin-antitoxin system